ncbi:MAG: ABC transporter permease [Ignavibacteriaceae bacterium]
MIKIFAIAKWEFLQKVKTKAFFISLIITPVILISFTIGGTLLSGQAEDSTKAIGFVDTSGIYFHPMREKIEEFKLQNGQQNYLLINFTERNKTLAELKKRADENVLKNRIEGYVLVYNGGTDSLRLEFRSLVSINLNDTRKFEQVFNEVKTNIELSKYGIAPDVISKISKEFSIEQIKIKAGGEESKTDFILTFFSSIIFIMMLMTVVMASGGMLVRSLVEEKSNRLIDIIISSCTSSELLSGKIIGLSSVGLFQILIWVIIGILISGYAVIPQQAMDNIPLILVYFILGFFFYTAIFVGIGSIVTTDQEAQQLTGYLSLILVFPVVLALPAIENPDASIITFFSYVPLTLPTIMMLRLNLSPISLPEILATVIIMIISIFLTIVITSKIFRIGILSYGKMPSLKEMIRWMREKE